VSGPGGFAGSHPGRVAIVGAGQVGTMLGMALTWAGARAGIDEVFLWDPDAVALAASLERGSGHRPAADMDDVLSADTILLAIPVGAIVGWLHEFGPAIGAGTFVMDTGSAKHGVVEAMRRTVPDHAHALGGHPIAGSEVSGPAGADPHRLNGATFVLCPVRDDPLAVSRGRSIAEAVAATPFEMEAGEHDRVIARTSHLPHLAACALATVAGTLAASDRDGVHRLAATGFAGATRLAAGDPTMISAFLQANRREAGMALSELIQELTLLGRALEDSDPTPLEEALAAGRAARRAVA
jgi:prephenate dehydrogenase